MILHLAISLTRRTVIITLDIEQYSLSAPHEFATI